MNLLRAFFYLLIIAFSSLAITLSSLAKSSKAQNTNNPPTINSNEVPQQILHTGVDLSVQEIAPNTQQLADLLGVTPLLRQIRDKRESLLNKTDLSTIEDLRNSQQLTFSIVEAMQIIEETNLSVDFTLAEITAEQNIYTDILSNYQSNRDRDVLKTNALSFITNGILWAVAEGLDIPTYRYPRLSISSGTTGVLAGIVPSIASIYALHQLNGRYTTSETDPNMLAKLFDYPTNPEIEYPKSVWQFLNAIPANEKDTKTRRDQLIERWIADKNIPNFTDRNSKDQLDIITASASRRKGLSIPTLNVRQIMLQQLSAEILKMKRMLLELAMVVHGEKKL